MQAHWCHVLWLACLPAPSRSALAALDVNATALGAYTYACTASHAAGWTPVVSQWGAQNAKGMIVVSSQGVCPAGTLCSLTCLWVHNAAVLCCNRRPVCVLCAQAEDCLFRCAWCVLGSSFEPSYLLCFRRVCSTVLQAAGHTQCGAVCPGVA
jgi:hypothetical protein